MRIVPKVCLIALNLFLFNLPAKAQLNRLFVSYDFRNREEIDIIKQTSTDPFSVIVTQTPTSQEPEINIIIDTLNGWKTWRTTDNYAFGKDRGSMQMITELDALHPYFRDKILALINNCNAQGIQLAVVESYRTHAKQNEYKTMGKKYTRSGAGKSKHQYGLAVDLVPIIDSAAQWHNEALWKKIGLAGEKLGLRWGGRWRHPYDPGHFEWTSGITTNDLAIGKLPRVPKGEDHYPCINEDIKLLRRYWKEWEVNQSSIARK